MTDSAPLVLVPLVALDDILELARLASERLGDDQLGRSLRAAAAQIRVSVIAEP